MNYYNLYYDRHHNNMFIGVPYESLTEALDCRASNPGLVWLKVIETARPEDEMDTATRAYNEIL